MASLRDQRPRTRRTSQMRSPSAIAEGEQGRRTSPRPCRCSRNLPTGAGSSEALPETYRPVRAGGQINTLGAGNKAGGANCLERVQLGPPRRQDLRLLQHGLSGLLLLVWWVAVLAQDALDDGG